MSAKAGSSRPSSTGLPKGVIAGCGAIPDLSDIESVVDPSMATTNGDNTPKLECDYDVNPTVLYQAVEAKQWDYAAGLFKGGDIAKQAATWVCRKEANGKLRWRLLPLHAAIIFGAPLNLVELLLSEFSVAAQCKDDQGMLPLHLAFRHESSWEIIEELLTANPQGIYVKDRKSRTPIQCGTQAPPSAPAPSGGASVTSQQTTAPQHSKTFRSVASLIELYSQVAISAQRQLAVNESRSVLEKQVAKLQDSHLQTLTLLKKEWQSQQEESKIRVHTLTLENEEMKKKLDIQDKSMSAQAATQKDLTDKLRQVTTALQMANEKNGHNNMDRLDIVQKTNQSLRMLVQDLVEEQKEYHAQFDDLMKKYERLSEDRQRVLAVFDKQTSLQTEKEQLVLKNFKSWMSHRMKKLEQNEVNVNEEKKVEDVMNYVTKTTGIAGTSFGHPVISPTNIRPAVANLSTPISKAGPTKTLEVKTVEANGEPLDVIDLSRLGASPKIDP